MQPNSVKTRTNKKKVQDNQTVEEREGFGEVFGFHYRHVYQLHGLLFHQPHCVLHRPEVEAGALDPLCEVLPQRPQDGADQDCPDKMIETVKVDPDQEKVILTYDLI